MDKLKKLSIIILGMIILSIGISSIVTAYEPYNIDNVDAGLLGLGVMVIIGIFLAVFIIFILIAIWVYRDAEKRGSSGVLWLLIVLLTQIIGLIIWLVVRPPIGGHPKQQSDQGRMCPGCGRPIPMDAQICPYCGKDFRAPKQ